MATDLTPEDIAHLRALWAFSIAVLRKWQEGEPCGPEDIDGGIQSAVIVAMCVQRTEHLFKTQEDEHAATSENAG